MRRIQEQSSDLLGEVSIVVPVGPNEPSWRSLIQDLKALGSQSELLLVAVDAAPSDLYYRTAEARLLCTVRWLVAPPGRARQMNLGVDISSRPYLWFLHADSRLSPDALLALARAIEEAPNAVHYFDLAFQDDGPSFAQLNALGARFRSHRLGLPFGDQGLCMSRETFERLGRFDERACYGEDHLLVWAAHRAKVPLHFVGKSISSSARKYREHGWLKTTLLHIWRTWRQAAGQWLKLVRSRMR